MRISVATHGGIAAGINLRRRPAVVDSARLPQPEVQELRRLVAAVRAEPAPPAGTGRARDAMTHVITVDDGAAPDSFTASDVTMTPAFAGLRGWLRDHT
jgi:hypothetical protein